MIHYCDIIIFIDHIDQKGYNYLLFENLTLNNYFSSPKA